MKRALERGAEASVLLSNEETITTLLVALLAFWQDSFFRSLHLILFHGPEDTKIKMFPYFP